jgi:hypothetical protein
VKQSRILKKTHEIKKIAQDMKEELNEDMENLRKRTEQNPGNKKFLNQIKNTVESYSSRLEQVEGRISGLEDKTDIKEKQINS